MTADDLVHLRRARDLMDREYAWPLDVPALARAAHMSPSHFSRRFHTAYGETPYSRPGSPWSPDRPRRPHHPRRYAAGVWLSPHGNGA